MRGSDQLLGFIDGDQMDDATRFVSSGYSLKPFLIDDWNHVAVLGEGAEPNTFLNGVFVGQISIREQSDLYYIGNSSEVNYLPNSSMIFAYTVPHYRMPK